ncbi:hypothetical protein BDP81DRAFT_451191 [Colletotrichum phormii]|uniref:Uncharacterized protein n=1 Tax=Colletotrichum phormii TaxID=359342 RepID=A0AAJ0ED41_9PEZI|nr:uncharacterized protein BDP81DRAFT_451191 [Colletotrichum phormii]KAK1634659.1 hypothetical protein BDP81DRAFT_451191 [Colletotrichum phormii]
MAALANKGLNLSKRMLKSHNASDLGQFSESMHRATWMSYLCRCNASIVSCAADFQSRQPFDEPIDSSSFKTPYPSSGEVSELWAQYIRAEESLVAATLTLAELLKGFNSEATASSSNRNIGAQLNQPSLGQPQAPELLATVDNPESKLVICLRITTRARLMRYRAFMDHPQILRFESIPPSDTSIGLAQGQVMHGIGIHTACSANLAGFTLMMISHFQTSANAADHAMSSSAILYVQHKCKTQLKVAVNALDRFSNAFGFVKALKGFTAPQVTPLQITDNPI